MAKARFAIELWPLARKELDALRKYHRRRIVDDIKVQLSDDPLTVTRKKKPLPGVVAGFEFDPPLWELKVGEHRVFYDVDDVMRIVNVRAVRYKPRDKTTAEVVQ